MCCVTAPAIYMTSSSVAAAVAAGSLPSDFKLLLSPGDVEGVVGTAAVCAVAASLAAVTGRPAHWGLVAR